MWRKINGIAVQECQGHAMCAIKDIDSLLTCVYVFGGKINRSLSNAMYCIHTDVEKVKLGDLDWEKSLNPRNVVEFLTTTGKTPKAFPDARMYHTITSLQTVKSMETMKFAVFGGIGEGKQMMNDFWIFDTRKMLWSKPKLESTVNPQPRCGHTLTIIERLPLKLLLFGGLGQDGEYLNDIWIVTDKSTFFEKDGKMEVKEDIWEWKQVHQQSHSSYYLIDENKLRLVQLNSLTGPCGRSHHTSVLIDTHVYVFGGKYLDQRLGDLWCLDLENLPKWRRIQCTGSNPSPRYGHIAIPLQHFIVVFGGSTSTESRSLSNDLYLFDTDGDEWGMKINPHNKVLPMGRFHFACACFAGERLLIFGGTSCGTNGSKMTCLLDVWVCETGVAKKDKIGKFNLKNELGRGAFASVQLAVHEQTQKEYALKRITIRFGSDRTSNTDRLMKEIDLLNKFNHRNILTIADSFLDAPSDSFIIVMPVCHYGTLVQYMKMRKTFTELELLNLIIQFLEGMVETHSKGIIHRDIKPENILVSRDEKDEPVVVIADFGLATTIEGTPSEKRTRRGSIAGTPGFMAVEAYQRKISFALDVWSIGTILMYVFTRSLDFVKALDFTQYCTDEARISKTIEKTIIAIELKITNFHFQLEKKYYKWIRQCLNLDYEKRPTVEELLIDVKSVISELSQNPGSNCEEVIVVPTLSDWLTEINSSSCLSPLLEAGFDDLLVICEMNEDEILFYHLDPVKVQELKIRVGDYTIQVDFTSVKDWLASISLDFYTQHFYTQGFDDIDVLCDLTEEDLIECIGIKKPGHVKKILLKCREIKEQFK